MRLHRDGVALSSEQLKNNGHGRIVMAAGKYFDSWPEAVTAAGAPRFKRGRWKSWASVRDRLCELHRNGERMTIAALQARQLADLVAAAQAYAGSWNKALAKAKVPVVQEHRAWNAKMVLEEIRALQDAGIGLNANLAIARGQRKLVKAETSYFGTWQSACRAAVPSYQPLVARWTVKRLVEKIRDRHRAGSPSARRSSTRSANPHGCSAPARNSVARGAPSQVYRPQRSHR